MTSRARLAGTDSMLRRRIRAALPQAMKDHDRTAVSALRSALGVLAHAEAAPLEELSDLEVLTIVRAEAEVIRAFLD